MSTFPMILLFTTVFRISLNVSSTRLILTTGDPGEIVRQFGQFVGAGNIVVGVIVFIILILVQFMVINKGSDRVAEVTARFTLDAMPGKQMAIDADLNTGAITDEQAKQRREKIQDESAFFGSMDTFKEIRKTVVNNKIIGKVDIFRTSCENRALNKTIIATEMFNARRKSSMVLFIGTIKKTIAAKI